jgi:hypothetical protein
MLPKDKFDLNAVEQLRTMNAQQVIPLLPKMLEWIQDMNWPVAKPMVEVLLNYPTEITPFVEEVLRGDDEMWIYWCLTKLVPNLPFYSKLVLVDTVEEIASRPITAFNEDLVEAAKEALKRFEP